MRQTGLSVAFDLPTLMGRDSDDPLAEGEVGKGGAPVSSLEDMEALFRGIPLADVSVSMNVNDPAAVLWALYLVAAERQGADPARLSGALGCDILKESIAGREFIFPLRSSMRLATDTIEYGARHTPRFHPVSIAGYHIREAGSTALQELAFALRDGIEYADRAVERGLNIDEFAPGFSFFFSAHSDFFEEIAKYRAARKMWANIMRDRFGAQDERSLKLRFHAWTAECSLTWQQPYNNVVRTGLQAMSAVLGGAQSLHANAFDEACAVPGEHAATLALRTRQVIAYESGIPAVPDPFGGSWFVERLTLDLEKGALDYIRRIDEMGGMIPAIEKGYPQNEIARSSYEYRRRVETGEAVVVGVNRFQDRDRQERPLDVSGGDGCAESARREKLRRLRAQRSSADVERTLDDLRRAAEGNANLMPPLLDAARAYATVGEMCGALRDVLGTRDVS